MQIRAQIFAGAEVRTRCQDEAVAGFEPDFTELAGQAFLTAPDCDDRGIEAGAKISLLQCTAVENGIIGNHGMKQGPQGLGLGGPIDRYAIHGVQFTDLIKITDKD